MLELNIDESVPRKDSLDEKRDGSDRLKLEQADIETQRQISLAREGIYIFLSRVFMYEIDNEFLTVIAAVQPALESLSSSQRDEDLKKASDMLVTFREKAKTFEGEERGKLLTDLAVEFAALFLVPGKDVGQERVWPWESAYFTDPPRMFDEPYHECIQAYRLVGYEKPKDFNEGEDHIALELDFMAHLCRLALTSIDGGRIDFAAGYVKLQKEFLQDHLLRWVGKFSSRLVKISKRRPLEFYRAIAIVLDTFVTMDDHVVDDVSEKLKSISDAQQKDKTMSSALNDRTGTISAA